MKKVALFTGIFLLASCGKENLGFKKKEPSFTLTSVAQASQTPVSPGTGITIGQYTFSFQNMEGVSIDQINFQFSGSLSIAQLKNFRTVIKDADSVVLLDAPLSAVDQTLMWYRNTVPLARPGTYTLTITSDVAWASIGDLTLAVQIMYDWNGGANQNQTDYKSSPTITFGTKSSLTVSMDAGVNTVITNGSNISMAKVKVSTSGMIAVKQFAYRIRYADNSKTDTVNVDSLRFYKDSRDVTNEVTITDSLGNPVTVLSELVAAHRKIYVTFNGESVVQGSADFDLQARVNGLSGVSNTDAISITPLTDAAAPAVGASYVVRASASDTRARLSTDPSSITGALVWNFIWSDLSSASHSAIYGIASNDWRNGATVSFTGNTNIYHNRETTFIHPVLRDVFISLEM